MTLSSATLVPVPAVPGTITGEVLREDDHEWVVRANVNGREALTRIARRSVSKADAAAIRTSVLGGPPLDDALPWELRRIFEGYRVRAALPASWALPAVLDAGVTDEGLPYVTRAWIDGIPLSRGWVSLVPELRDEVLVQVLELLELLHGAGIVVQDLKPDNTVLDAEARLWLVDLESLRTAPAGAVPCTHYTPKFAAPEQLRGRVSMPQSDLFAFGRMVAELTGGLPTPRWSPVVGACLHEDPRLRPTAAVAARGGILQLEPVDATIRVPEPDDLDSLSFFTPTSPTAATPSASSASSASSTSRSAPTPPVPAPGGPVAASVIVEPSLVGLVGELTGETQTALAPAEAAEAPTAPRRSRWTKALAVFSGVAMVSFAVALAVSWRLALENERAVQIAGDRVTDRLVDEVRDDLRDHKVVAARNNDQELARVLVLARQAAVLRPDRETLGLTALATVWSQRWHWRGARWDREAFTVADELSHDAMVAGETPAGVLARGLTAAAACRHAPASEPIEIWCDEAITRLDRAAVIGPDWLKVEAYWGAVMVLDSRARRALDRSDEVGAVAFAEQALRRCELARPALPAAKVNGPELVEDCVWSAGAARDRARWFAWTSWQLEHATDRVTVPPALLGSIVRSAAPECARLETDGVGLPTELTPWAQWCGGMGLRALRCAGMTLDPDDPARGTRPAFCSRG